MSLLCLIYLQYLYSWTNYFFLHLFDMFWPHQDAIIWPQELCRDIYDLYAEYEDEDEEDGCPGSPSQLLLPPNKHLNLNINVGGTVSPILCCSAQINHGANISCVFILWPGTASAAVRYESDVPLARQGSGNKDTLPVGHLIQKQTEFIILGLMLLCWCFLKSSRCCATIWKFLVIPAC